VWAESDRPYGNPGPTSGAPPSCASCDRSPPRSTDARRRRSSANVRRDRHRESGFGPGCDPLRAATAALRKLKFDVALTGDDLAVAADSDL